MTTTITMAVRADLIRLIDGVGAKGIEEETVGITAAVGVVVVPSLAHRNRGKEIG